MRARGSVSTCRRSSVLMAVDVGKSPSEESLSGKAEGNGRWDGADTEMDFLELAGSLHQLLGTEEAKPSLQGTESVAVSRHSHMATGVTQEGSSCHPKVSSAFVPRFSRASANSSGKGVLVDRAADGGPVPRRVGHWFLSSEEEQVKASGSWDPVSSPPSRRSSAEENILAGSRHDAHVGRRRQSLGAQSPSPSTPELLRPQTPPSPESALRSRSALSLSALSSEGNGPPEEPSGSLPASTDVPSPAATTAARDLCCRWGAEGRALQRREPSGPLLDYRSTVGHIREISYQADYWACAIPDSLPPSPDRSSPHWNPNKEYEDLLDYAYPLKPRYKLGRMPEPFLHDSGIGLDSFSTSPEGVSRSTSIYGRAGQARGSRENGLWEFVASAERLRFSTPRPGKRGCSGTGSYYEPLPVAKASFARSASSHPSRGFAQDVRVESSGPSSPGGPAANGRSWDTGGSPCPNYTGQMFCFQLEELIHWLYSVVDVTGSWVPPSPDAESVLASLHRYLEFRKDVADHRSLTESVLERGEALLDCMASNSPALKDTLGLIARQSEELESHAEHLYKSILAAVGKDTGQDKGAAAHGCSLGAASVRPRLR
ncbi:centrosomal protein of 68 kDa isoform X3 [Poecile atricapillus]|uniref:centrosomal protein of 68 kDa isoform X3 n=1 Tax=Poecile atricapillus TaxID=48891 RepID=UPI0027399CF9|nr:centrosomal protein of 68 kDa isoform X3 [Poecile atricapillus]